MSFGRGRLAMSALSLGLSVFCVSTRADATGTISGQVTDASTGMGFALCVNFHDDQGGWLNSSCPADGQYTSPPLEPGSYYVATNNWSGYYDEVYDDILCNPLCDVTIGTVVVVGDGAVQGIDFELEPGGGWFAGRLTDASTGAGVGFTPVLVYDTSGVQIGFGWANPPNGVYTTKGALETGTYFAITDPEGYLGELFDDHPCPDGVCDPTAGTPISVTAGTGTYGIDFALLPIVVFGDGFESGNTSAWSVTVAP